jgi:hypothetical protein
MYLPEIESIVRQSCKNLIIEYGFIVTRIAKHKVYLTSEKCGIRIMAGISPIGEQQIEIDFFDPQFGGPERKYIADTFLLYIYTRHEPRDVIDDCIKNEIRTEQNFDETIRIALKCFTAHTLKYRQDILNGDFTSWLPGNASST